MNAKGNFNGAEHAPRRKSTFFYTGLVVGILDALAAIIPFMITYPNANPIRIFQYIASAVFGKQAFANNTVMPLAGLLFHFLIAFIFTFIYFALFPRLKFLSSNVVVSGLLYGLFVWIIMNLVILPITRVPQTPIQFLDAIKGAVVLMFVVGLPIAIGAKRYYQS